MNAPRSGCPINLTLNALGDRWSLIVIRDLMFGNRRHFRELLTRSEERIASNILADRLTRLEKAGLVSRRDDPSHKQKVIYSLTEASIALVPLLAHMGGWGLRHTPASKELSVRAKILEDGGPKLWSEFMEELRHLHLLRVLAAVRGKNLSSGQLRRRRLTARHRPRCEDRRIRDFRDRVA